MEILFVVSLSMLVYIYLAYPALLWILARVFGREPRRSAIVPSISLLIPAYNEASHIEEKLRNSLALDYPKSSLEIAVASDGSTDETDAIVKRFASEGIRLIAMERNIGKSAMLTRVIPCLKGELVVFSDASGELERGALRKLVRAFADPRVGCVSGAYCLKGAHDMRAQGEGAYWKYETFIKRQESLLHSILGAHGAFYAIRKGLFEPLETAAINDDYLIPMRITKKGFRAVYEPEAVAWEREVATLEGEFARRRRIAAGNCQQTIELLSLLDPRRGWLALCFFSHKVLRTLAPLLMLAMLLASAGLAFPYAGIALALQGLFYASAVVGYLCQRRGHRMKVLSAPLYFCLGNLAMLSGLLNYCFSRKPLVWERAR